MLALLRTAIALLVPVFGTELGCEIRGAFGTDGSGLGITEPTVLLSVDYSRIELRVLAHVTGGPALREAFQRGEDVHAVAAARLYGVPPEDVTAEMRRVGKILNYGVIYGMTGYRLALEAGIDQKEAARRAAENMPNQGMVAEIAKLAMIRMHARLREEGMASCTLLRVQDELVLEVPEGSCRGSRVGGAPDGERSGALRAAGGRGQERALVGEMRRLGDALGE